MVLQCTIVTLVHFFHLILSLKFFSVPPRLSLADVENTETQSLKKQVLGVWQNFNLNKSESALNTKIRNLVTSI